MPDLKFRPAEMSDIRTILELTTADWIGETSDNPDAATDPAYLSAMSTIRSDPNQMLTIAELDGEAIGTLHLTFIPRLTRIGRWICVVENVHIRHDHRNAGYGEAMMRWAISKARERTCVRVELTSNKQRSAAHRFYERLGFSRSHEGFKLYL